MTTLTTTLAVNHLTKRYGDFTAVDDLSFVVHPGEIFGLLGPNGAGKTTTIRMIMDIFKADSGTIDLLGASPGHNIHRIGYLPEERGLYQEERISEMLIFLAHFKGLMLDPLLPAYAEDYRLLPSETNGEAALRGEEISALVMIPSTYMENGEVTVMSAERGGGFSGINAVGRTEMSTFLRAHLLRERLDPALYQRILDPYTPTRISLQTQGATEQSEAASVGNVMFGYAFGILLGIAVFTSAGYLLQGVARDKSDRIVEILLSSVSARQLLAGKVLGLGALGLTQLAVWLGSLLLLGIVGTTALGVTPAVFQFVFARPEFLLFDILYFVLGFLLYALLMGSVGALGTSQQESQQMAGIFTFFAVIPFMLGGVFLNNPNALLVRILSWFPITAPTAMLLRLPLSPTLPWIDMGVSLTVLLATIALAIWAGGKVFRLGLLIYGQRPTVGRVLRALREA